MRNRSKLLLISSILGTLYLFNLLNNFVIGTFAAEDSLEILGGALATAIVFPHIIFVGLSVIFNWIGFSMRVRWAALVSGILYTVAMLFMFIYAPFVIIQMILSFVAFSKMKNIK